MKNDVAHPSVVLETIPRGSETLYDVIALPPSRGLVSSVGKHELSARVQP